MTMENLIYVKECLGREGKPIRIYKIRTMDLDADQRLDEIVLGFDGRGHPISDPRITLIGRFLRKYWIDELPQLYNLSKGDIKLIGIRPNGKADWQKYPTTLMERAFKQKPGLMGVQYAYPNTDNFNTHLAHLTEYMDRWEENPIKTDKIYLSRIVWNILLGKAKGS